MTHTTATTTDLRALTGTYTIDSAHSRVGFVARHRMATRVRGAFNAFEATAFIDGADAAMSSVSVTLQAASIDTRNDKRDRYLRTKFLDAGSHPTITFTSKSVSREGDDDFVVTGDLTIKGVTKSISIPLAFQGAMKDPSGSDRLGFAGSVVINRKDWGVNWRAALGLVSEKVTLEFEIHVIHTACPWPRPILRRSQRLRAEPESSQHEGVTGGTSPASRGVAA
jgi:polyisoprenoid-binding protein YceI